ncbi:MAG: hypothetical protein RLZZ450_57 [Pseudomonadota bacterium]|jgi:stringent starvation protein B
MSSKHDVFLSLYARYPGVFVHFDGFHTEVIIGGAKRSEGVVFQYGKAQARPIPDLDVNSLGIRGTLSFGGQQHWTFVPWLAVWAIAAEGAQDGGVWAADVPERMMAVLKENAQRAKKPKSDVRELKATKAGAVYEREDNIIRPRFGAKRNDFSA